jgi:hypothetical protein
MLTVWITKAWCTLFNVVLSECDFDKSLQFWKPNLKLNVQFPGTECTIFSVLVSEAVCMSQARIPQYQSVLGFQIGTKPIAASINCPEWPVQILLVVCEIIRSIFSNYQRTRTRLAFICKQEKLFVRFLSFYQYG